MKALVAKKFCFVDEIWNDYVRRNQVDLRLVCFTKTATYWLVLLTFREVDSDDDDDDDDGPGGDVPGGDGLAVADGTVCYSSSSEEEECDSDSDGDIDM